MSEIQNKQNKNWHKLLCDRALSLSEQLGLDDTQTLFLRDFVVTIAKDQYLVGNKSGIAWAFKQAREQGWRGTTAPIAAATN